MSRPGIEPGPAAWQARMLPPDPQRWTLTKVTNPVSSSIYQPVLENPWHSYRACPSGGYRDIPPKGGGVVRIATVIRTRGPTRCPRPGALKYRAIILYFKAALPKERSGCYSDRRIIFSHPQLVILFVSFTKVCSHRSQSVQCVELRTTMYLHGSLRKHWNRCRALWYVTSLEKL